MDQHVGNGVRVNALAKATYYLTFRREIILGVDFDETFSIGIYFKIHKDPACSSSIQWLLDLAKRIQNCIAK